MCVDYPGMLPFIVIFILARQTRRHTRVKKTDAHSLHAYFFLKIRFRFIRCKLAYENIFSFDGYTTADFYKTRTRDNNVFTVLIIIVVVVLLRRFGQILQTYKLPKVEQLLNSVYENLRFTILIVNNYVKRFYLP